MPTLRMMSKHHGDLVLDEWTKGDETTIARARESFKTNFTAGRLAFRMDPARPGFSEIIREFDQEAEDILIVPSIQGGGECT